MTASQFASELEASRQRLFDSIKGLTEEQFRFAPEAEAWSIAAHLAHLLRIERVLTERARAALTEDEPSLASTRVLNDDDPVLAQRLAVPQMIHGLQAARRDLLTLLDTCGDGGLGRAIRHERLGRMTVEAIAVKMAQHENEHAEEIDALARQAPAAGRVTIPLTPR